MEPQGILIYGEINENKIAPIVFELISKSKELKEKIWNQKIKVCIIGDNQDYTEITNKLGSYGADEIIIIQDERLKTYNKNYHAEIFTKIAKEFPPRIILVGATPEGKEVSAYTATKLQTGLTADCTDLNIGEKDLLLSTRPTFGGQLMADILCKTFPQMATVQQNIFKAEKVENKAEVIFKAFNLDEIEKKIEVIEIIKKEFSKEDITNAQIVVAGGKGACKDNGFELINELARKLNASVAGSREAFELGYITKSQQIGQTGKTIAPQLYIAIGISGAIQHITGIKNSGKIIAINNDNTAPIFKNADIGIVGDLFDILPKLIEELN